jgi:hypothetical protein
MEINDGIGVYIAANLYQLWVPIGIFFGYAQDKFTLAVPLVKRDVLDLNLETKKRIAFDLANLLNLLASPRGFEPLLPA